MNREIARDATSRYCGKRWLYMYICISRLLSSDVWLYCFGCFALALFNAALLYYSQRVIICFSGNVLQLSNLELLFQTLEVE